MPKEKFTNSQRRRINRKQANNTSGGLSNINIPINRSDFLKVAFWGCAGLVGAIATGEVIKSFSEAGKERMKSETISEYEDAFRNVAKGDEEAEKVFDFYTSNRFDEATGEGVLRVELSDQEVYQGVVSGSSYYKNNVLHINPMDSTDLWKGVLYAHEVKHAYDDINGFEGPTDYDFYLGEVNAYEMEFRLLDNATNGKFNEILEKETKNIPNDSYRVGISEESLIGFREIFPPPKSEDEVSIRIASFVVAQNFAEIDSRFDNKDLAEIEKVNYLKAVANGMVPLYPIYPINDSLNTRKLA